MADFRDQDLSSARFEHVRLPTATFTDVDLSDTAIRGADLTGADIHATVFNKTRMRGAELVDVDIYGELQNVIVSGVDIAPLVDAELNQRMPERAKLHRSIDDEWSFSQTLRHLNFASAAWVGRMILGNPAPWHPLDLPWDEAPGWDGIPWDREARPSLAEVLAVRRERQAMVSQVLESLTDEQLAAQVTRTEPGCTPKVT